MPEQLQKILDRVVEWWKKFSNKQRMLLISLTAVVILALVILGVVVSRPSYTTLIDCQNAKEASQVKDLLDGEGDIDYKVTDTIHFEVNKKMRTRQTGFWDPIILIQRDLTCQIRTSRIISTEVFLPRRQINRNLPKAIWKINWRMCLLRMT